jgi:hypothetical protein
MKLECALELKISESYFLNINFKQNLLIKQRIFNIDPEYNR